MFSVEKRAWASSRTTLMLVAAGAFSLLFISHESVSVLNATSRASQHIVHNSAVRRNVPNLIFWTQRKTGSTSIRLWLRALAHRANLGIRINGGALYYPVETFHSRVSNCNCTVFAGHIVIPDVRLRPHEAEKGALFTTTRAVYNHLVSKFYHNTKRSVKDDLPELHLNKSKAAAVWYLTWREYDPCEPMRYYDGIPGCPSTDSGLRARAAAIASRVDCVIDMEDSRPDVEAICSAMKVEDCPEVPTRNVRAGSARYQDVLQYPHIRNRLNAAAHALQILRDALLKRRCRDMLGGGGKGEKPHIAGDLPPAKWPTPNCKQDYGWRPRSLPAAK